MTMSPNRPTPSPRTVEAQDHRQPVTAAFAVPALEASSTSSRQLSGLVVPYGRPGNTSAGRVTVRAGAVRLPSELSRVKLVDKHTSDPRGWHSVGYAVHAESRPDGLHMTFQLGRSAEATAVLEAAEDKTTDGLSVELTDVQLVASATDVPELTGGELSAVASVPLPAFPDARVTNLAASNRGENMDCPTCGHRHPVTAACVAPQLVATQTPQPTPAPQPVQPQPTPAPQPVQPEPTPAPQPVQPEPAPAPAPEPVQPTVNVYASAPPMLQPLGGTFQAASQPSDTDLFAALHRVMTGQSRPELEAALADIVNTDVYSVVGQDTYVGRLWSGQPYRRRFVPLLRPGRLTSWKITGWKWGVMPEVDDYAGDKADVPSNAPTVLPASTTAARLAGGHDLDRKFRDFGDTEFIGAYLEAMAESYAKKSDAKALAFILANATDGTDTAAGAGLLDAVMLASDQVEDLTDGVPADYVLVNRADRRTLMDVTNNEAPAYARELGVAWDKIIPSNDVPAGQVVAGVKAAGTFYELPGAPVRVEALDIARGGIDEALFGYWAALLHDARGIVRSNITPSV